MPAVTILPSASGPTSFPPPALGKKTPAFQENGQPPRGASVTQNGSGVSYDDMTAAEIKKAAGDWVHKKARQASALSLIKIAGSRYREAKEHEDKGELKRSLGAYYQALTLAQMALGAPNSDRTVSGEINEFFKYFQQDRFKKVEEKVKLSEKSRSVATPPSNGPITSIADRMKALQDNGLDISVKRPSRPLHDATPASPPKSSPAPSSLPSPLILLPPLKPSPPGSSVPSPSPHTLVSPSQLGPPSPTSSPTLSPQLDTFDTAEFTAFPSIEELDERPDFALPSSTLSAPFEDLRSTESASHPSSSLPSYTTPKPYSSTNERRPGTPTFPNFSSLPGSPHKPTVPLKPSGLSYHHLSFPPKDMPGKSLIPVKDTATPAELREYMRERRKILLLDVRDRYRFERDHIEASAVACIEPLDLVRGNLTIEQLEVSIASKPENVLFFNRDKFDIVVVYDESSVALGGSQTPLSILVRLIGGRSGTKLLRRVPMLLVGGLNAWKREDGESSEDNQNIGITPPPPPDTPIVYPLNQPQQQIWTPPPQPDLPSVNGHHINGSLDRLPTHIRSPAEISYPASSSLSNQISRKPASSPVFQTRSIDNLGSLSGFPAFGSPINYPQVPKRAPPLLPLPLGSGTAAIQPGSIISPPPLASINPSPLSRKRSDYIDPSQEALSNYNRASVDYPRLSASQVSRPPPAAASSVVRERQDVRFTPFSPTADPPKTPPPLWFDWPTTTRITPRGLSNLGNTCWMNSMVQCLNATAPFANYFLDGRWRPLVDPTKGRLTVAYAQLLIQMRNAGDQKYIVPGLFHDIVTQFMPHFERGKQHDSQEFLGTLLDRIDEDLKPLAKPEPLMIQKPGESAPSPSQPINTGIVASCFQSECSSRLQCSTCETTSVTYEHFNFLQLSVPHVKEKNNVPQKVSIYTCLDEFFREEIMEKDNQWLCPKCNKTRTASKKVSLTRPPAVLILHLKRYTLVQDGWGERMIRNNAFVDSPLEELDLSRYVSSPTNPDDTGKQSSVQAPSKYRLYGVTNHSGSESLDRGHYTALISSDGGWLKFSDTQVSGPINPREVVSSEAYVLFYRRVKS